MEQRVSLITLAVADLARSEAFYEVLGWVQVDRTDDIAVYDLIGQSLSLYSRAKLAEDLGVAETQIGGFSGVTLGHNVREMADVARVLQRAETAGGRIVQPAADVFWGGHHGFFADLDGHIWEVAFNPFAPLRADGGFRWRGYSADGEP